MKIVIASGYSANIKVQDMLKEGAVDFIQKPYYFEELNKKIRDVLGAP